MFICLCSQLPNAKNGSPITHCILLKDLVTYSYKVYEIQMDGHAKLPNSLYILQFDRL